MSLGAKHEVLLDKINRS